MDKSFGCIYVKYVLGIKFLNIIKYICLHLYDYIEVWIMHLDTIHTFSKRCINYVNCCTFKNDMMSYALIQISLMHSSHVCLIILFHGVFIFITH